MQNNMKSFINPETFGLMPAFRPFPFDVKMIMESARKNAQAFSAAQQVALEGFQTLSARQSTLISQTIENQLRIAREILAEGTPEEKIIRQAEAVQTYFERTISASRETNDMITKSINASMDIINARFMTSMDDIKTAVKAPAKSNVTLLRKVA